MLKKMRSVVTKILITVLVLTSSLQPVQADDESDLESLQQQQEQIQQEQEMTGERLEKAMQKVAEMDAALKEMDEKIGKVETTIQELNAAIEENLQLLDVTKAELVQAEAEEQIWYEKLKLRIKAMYESGDVNYLEVLLQAGSMSELLSKAEYTRELAEYDQEIMSHLKECRAVIEEKQIRVEEEEKILEQNRAEEQAKKEELQIAREEKDAEMAELQSDADALALYEQKLEKEKDDLIVQITALEAEIEAKRQEEERRRQEEEKRRQEEEQRRQEEQQRLEQEQQQQQQQQQEEESQDPSDSGSSPSQGAVSGGGMVWPVPGYSYLSCYFGSNGHRGIDIPAPAGTPIVAAAGGTVITAQWNSSYGNYVAISHGNGMVTVYAHATTLCVSAGDTVSAGQTVALVGNTGYSFGNHLHFEVQINGGLYNPLNYVSP